MLTTIVIVAVLAAALAASIWWSTPRANRIDDLTRRIDALLPQTQCRRCTFEGCKPYATAIARGEAGINQCPPGGAETVVAIAELLRREPLPVDPKFGVMPQLLASAPTGLYPADDPDDLARAVLDLLDHPAVAAVPIDDWTHIVGEMEQRLRRIVGRN